MNEELQILKQSKKYVILLIFGILISLYNLNIEEKMIVCGQSDEEERRIKERQWISSAIIFSALIYFYNLTGKTTAESGFTNTSQNYAYSASILNLVAGLARFAGLASETNEEMNFRDQIEE